ncbi:MAG: hypothetical protein FWC41_11695, partial [Firmicutes bacterium]|nr:hypothetical protein [Bacillota bacterium]
DKYLYLQSELKFTHILIGGRSGTENYGESEKILAIVKHIRKSSDMPIYLMCLPPKNTEILNKYHAAGVTEISFNIEVFDRAWALKYMPGKGDIPLQRYLDALETAVMLWGRTGNVRSAFIVGLEPHKSLMEGIATLCKLGVAPILSVFRPLPETEMSNVIPPCNEELHNLYKEAQKICACYGLALGPACTKCQNNTLSFNESLT